LSKIEIELYIVVPFHDMIKNIVPDIIMLLKDNNKNIRSGGVEIIGKLAEYSM
jgi:hypothetical protein